MGGKKIRIKWKKYYERRVGWERKTAY